LWIEDAALEQWQVWKGRAGPLLGSSHSDEPDRAHGVQAAIAIDRGLDGVGHRIDGPGDFGAGSYGGRPSSGNATDGTREAGATRTIASLIGSIGLQVYGAGQWLEAKHGAKSRRTWRKLHLAVDAASCMIVAQNSL